MPDLDFQVTGVDVATFAAVPTLNFKLHIADAAPQAAIHSVLLRCQIQLATPRRSYDAREQAALQDLFGEPARWAETLRSMLWTHVGATVPAFTGATELDLPVPCSYDFNIAATKYFGALEDGVAPLLFLFSGTIFYAGANGGLQVSQISWNKEASFRLPVAVWREMMEHYYPNSAWLNLRKDVFDRLQRFRTQRGLPTWEQALEQLLAASEEQVSA